MKEYWYTKETSLKFEDAINKLKSTLLDEWFWVLTEIDIKSTIKEKIGEDLDNYIIIWACNPKIAYEALQNELEIWLILPCNVIIYESNWKVFISSILPTVAMDSIDNKKILEISKIAETKLKKAIDNVE